MTLLKNDTLFNIDFIRSYLNDNKLQGYLMNENDWWTDAGTHESLAKANELIKCI